MTRHRSQRKGSLGGKEQPEEYNIQKLCKAEFQEGRE